MACCAAYDKEVKARNAELERLRKKTYKAMRREARNAAPSVIGETHMLERRQAIDRKPRPVDLMVMRANQGGCAYCGSLVRMELDHKRALARGGLHVLSNLQYLCHDCNAAKGRTSDSEYRRAQGIPPRTKWDACYDPL